MNTPRPIPTNDLLLHCGQPLDAGGNESREGLFSYASAAVKVLLKDDIAIYEKLKLSVFDEILSGSRTIAELTRKKYSHAPENICAKLMPCVLLDLLTKGKPLFIYRITCENGIYALSPPQQIKAELTGNTRGMEKLAAALQRSASNHRSPFPFGLKRRTDRLRLKISVSLMRSAADDLRFISRFNEETFFRGLSEQSFASPLIDLSEKSVRIGFAALYAMTFFNLDPNDLFTVDSVFGFTDIGVRSKDDIRRTAAAELSSRIQRGDIADLADMADKMGARLSELSLPPVDADEPILLAKNCTLYAGFAQIGKAYFTALTPLETAIVPDEPGQSYKAAKPRAKLMARYDHALQLCQGILTLMTVKKPQLSALKGYKQTQALENEVQK